MTEIAGFGNLIAPLIAIIACWLYLFRRLHRTNEPLPLADVGFIFATFVSLYAIVPIVAALMIGDNINFLTDNRLRVYAPSPAEVGTFMWYYVAFLASFIAAYLYTRKGEIRFEIGTTVTRQFMPGVIFLAVTLSAYFIVLDITADVVTSTSYDEAFLDNVERYANLPLFLRQITGHLNGILLAAKIALAAIVAINIRQRSWRLYGGLWLVYELFLPFFQLGARSSSFFVILTFVLCYHKLIRPISGGLILSGSLSLFTAYLIQGVVRAGADLGELGFVESLLTANEFQSLFGTAFDMKMRVDAGTIATPSALFFADFLRLFPQQVIPFEKLDPSEWYLELIGYRGTGVGFSFGAISEAMIGFGLPDLLMRGAILGAVVGWIHNVACKRAYHFGWIIFYLWFCTRIYLSFRNSIFYWIGLFGFELLPAIILFNVLRRREKRLKPLVGVS